LGNRVEVLGNISREMEKNSREELWVREAKKSQKKGGEKRLAGEVYAHAQRGRDGKARGNPKKR